MQKNRKTPNEVRSGLISVFTPVYNDSEKRILRAFHSLKKQTHRNWEWVIYDDSDEEDRSFTWGVLTGLANADMRIKLIKGETHSGSIGFVKRKAAKACRGYVLVELDYDDELTPNCLQLLREAFDTFPDSGFAYTDFAEKYERGINNYHHYVDGWGKGFGSSYYERHEDHWALVGSSPFPSAIAFSGIVGVPNHIRAWRSSFYSEIGGHNPELLVADDYELLIRTVMKTKMIKIPILGYIQYFNRNQQNTTFNRNKLIQDQSAALSLEYREQLEQYFRDQGLRIENSLELPTYWSHSEFYDSIHETYPVAENLISIIMPTYNRPELLKRAIDSVKAQIYSNWELIIIGDKCPFLASIMEEEDDKRIRWWNLNDNHGAGGTVPRNYGLKMLARGDWIAYLDDDNYWTPDHLESLVYAVTHFPNTEAGADYGLASFKMGKVPIYCGKPQRYRVDTSTILHKKSLLEKYGYWKTREEAGYAHDWELVSRWGDHNWAVTNIPTLIYNTEFSNNDLEAIYRIYPDQPSPWEYWKDQ
jgi:glycosyltransferase involved in cell wall biosynthesis